ncbi:sterol desaturase family protein [Aquiflexum sp.]|uniref:sterol desaturase family protein n=1 Tax=Aquiflexum sp. TaxID=1872584 RepID=UPI003593237B
MKTMTEFTKKSKEIREVCRCIGTFLFIAISLLMIAEFTGTAELRFMVLLVLGWLTWTFIEYSLHRFWMHNFFRSKGNKIYDLHMDHHKNPTDIKISGFHRSLTFGGVILLMPLSIYLDNYFTVFTGFYIGFMLYSMLHVILHKPWSRYIMPNLQKSHIHHHGKYPNRGFSFSIILWDWMFGTLPPKEAKITEKMLEFYFKEEEHDHLHGKKFLM